MANTRILIVENTEPYDGEIEQRLNALGYSVCASVSDGAEAIEKIPEMQPALVMVNIGLEGAMAAVDAGEEIYHQFDIPVVLLIDSIEEDVLERLKGAKEFGHIFKPFDANQLCLGIERQLRWHELTHEAKGSDKRQPNSINIFGDAVISTDRRGLITFMNPVGETLTGWEIEEATGKRVTDILNINIGKSGNLKKSAILTEALQKGFVTAGGWTSASEVDHSTYLIAKSGREIPIDYNITPVKDEEETPAGIVITFRDIAKYKTTKEHSNQTISELRRQTQLMKTVFDSMYDGIVVFSFTGEILFLNPIIQQMIGKEYPGTSLSKWSESHGVFYSDKETLVPVVQLMSTHLAHGEEIRDLELFVRNKEQTEGIHLKASALPLLDENQEIFACVCIVHDITKDKMAAIQLEQTMRELQNQVQLTNTIFDSMYDGIIVLSLTGEILFLNPSAQHMIGTEPPDPFLGKWSDTHGVFCSDRETPVPVDQILSTHISKGKAVRDVELLIRNKERPEGIHIKASALPLLGEEQEVVACVAIVHDITKDKIAAIQLERTMQELQNQVQLTDTIFNSMGDGVIAADASGTFTIFNPSAERIVGIGAIDTTPDKWSDNYGLFFPDRVTPFPAAELPLARALRGEASDDVEMFVRNPDVPEGVFISVSGRPLQDDEGTEKGGVVVFRDVTHRVVAEEALTQAFAQGRLEIVETIVHNIGNAINSVTVGINVIQENLVGNEFMDHFLEFADAVKVHQEDWVEYIRDDPQGQLVLPFIIALTENFTDQNREVVETLERVSERVTHINDIIRTQKSYSQPSMMWKEINLQKAILGAVKLQQDSIDKRGIHVDVDCENAPEKIRIQESQFNQMLVNLVKNSIEAIDELARSGGFNETPRIAVKAYISEDFLCLDVTDNGVGIEQKHFKLVFTAGYTTKKSGTGLGLHSSANFVIGSGGKIYPLSEGIGKGTTMRIMLRCSSVIP